MSEYTYVTVEVPGEDEEFDIQVPREWLPRVGEVLDLRYDERFPEYARDRLRVAEVRWYRASGERYRPVLVVDI